MAAMTSPMSTSGAKQTRPVTASPPSTLTTPPKTTASTISPRINATGSKKMGGGPPPFAAGVVCGTQSLRLLIARLIRYVGRKT